MVREQSSIVRPLVVRSDSRLCEGAATVRLSIVRSSMHKTHFAPWAMRLSIVRLSSLYISGSFSLSISSSSPDAHRLFRSDPVPSSSAPSAPVCILFICSRYIHSYQSNLQAYSPESLLPRSG